MIREGADARAAVRQVAFSLVLAAGVCSSISAKAADGYFRAPIAIASPAYLSGFAEAIVGHYAERNPRTGFARRDAGTRQAVQQLCAAAGEREAADIAILPRRLWRSERRQCDSNAVAVSEHPIGSQALVVLASRGTPSFDLDIGTLYRATSGKAARWSALDPRLPDMPVRVLLPAPPSGLRTLLDEAGLQGGCQRAAAVQRIADAKERVAACVRLRGDGAVTEHASTADILAVLAASKPGTIALVPRDAMAQAVADHPVLSVDGVPPTVRAIRSGAYPLARHLYLYARQGGHRAADVPPDLQGVLLTATSGSFMRAGGYFERMGLILPLAEGNAPPRVKRQDAGSWVEALAARAESGVRSAWAGVSSLAGGIAGLFRADTPGAMAESVLRENQDLTRLLELAGFDLVRVERDGMFLPGLDATFSRRRDLTEVERGLLEYELDELAQYGLDFTGGLKLAVIEDLLDIADGGKFQIDEVVVTFYPLLSARYVLVPEIRR